MKKLFIKEIIKHIDGKTSQDNLENWFNGVSIDSRENLENKVFVAIKGENFDGHDFIEVAIRKGAVAVIAKAEKNTSNCYDNIIIVNDTLRALQDLAKYYLGTLNIIKVGITGSCGKTTTREMVHAVLCEKYNTLRNIKNYNNHIGVPLTIFMLEEYHEAAVFEMGMRGLGEISELCNIIRPNIAVITNIGLSHIERLGSKENILNAKWEIADYFDENCVLVLNDTDKTLKNKAKGTDVKILMTGYENSSDIVISKIISINEEFSEFIAMSAGVNEKVTVNIPGKHNIINASLALGVGISAKIPFNRAILGISKMKSEDKRLNVKINKSNIKIIDDTYNASPDSMKAGIDVLDLFQGRRKGVILSDMFELGAYSKEAHEEIGKYLLKKNIDIVLTTGEFSKYIFEVCNGDTECFTKHYESKEDMIKDLNNILRTDDVVLIKGSRGTAMEDVVNYLLNQ